MANLQLNGRSYSIDLIIFDKDGTLIQFHHLWSQKAGDWLTWLIQESGNNSQLAHTLYQKLGFDTGTQRIISESPLAVATMDELESQAATIFIEHGYTPETAVSLIKRSLPYLDSLPTAAQIRPLGKVKEKISELVTANVRIAIITSDNRNATEYTLPLLGIADLVDIVVCGDDPVPHKPNPRSFLETAVRCNVPPERVMMVGDTLNDMRFGRNGNAAACIAVRQGAGNPTELAQIADHLIDSIDEIMLA